MEALLPLVAHAIGVDPTTVLLALGVLVSIANLVGRLIPDDATGTLATIRKGAKIIGLYVPNVISRGVSVNDVAKQSIHPEEEYAPEPPVVMAFPGLANRFETVDDIVAQTNARLRKD